MENKFKEYVDNKELPCFYKWVSSSINLSTKSSGSCHKTSYYRFDINDFGSFHNTEEKQQDRQKMLDDIWPDNGCKNCRIYEIFGEKSERQWSNNFFNGLLENNESSIPKELLKNPLETKVTPKVIEISFDNLCNMKCMYCSSYNSTLWQEEDKKYEKKYYETKIKHVFLDKKDHTAAVNNFFNWLEKNHHELLVLTVQGGEPFLQNEVSRLIDFFDENPNKNIHLVFYSNLKNNLKKLDNYLQKLDNLYKESKIGKITIVCSIDGWGKEQEYVRSGLNLIQWEENFSYIVKSYPLIDLMTHSTICNLTLKSHPALIEKIIEYSKIRLNMDGSIIQMNSALLDIPNHLLIQNFPVGFFDADFNEIYKLYGSVDYFKTNVEKFKMYQRMVNNHYNIFSPRLIENLKNTLDVNDKKRNTDWKNTFKWLNIFSETADNFKYE